MSKHKNHSNYNRQKRVTGKDLLTNHCLFSLYTHTALFGEDKYPGGIRANGHLLINNANS